MALGVYDIDALPTKVKWYSCKTYRIKLLYKLGHTFECIALLEHCEAIDIVLHWNNDIYGRVAIQVSDDTLQEWATLRNDDCKGSCNLTRQGIYHAR